MAIGILGRKVGMTQLFDETGKVIPVTVIQAGPCHVLQAKAQESDGYEAVQLGFLDKPRRLASRSERGHVAKLDSRRTRQRTKAGVEPRAKADCEPKRFVREFRSATVGVNVGDVIDVGTLAEVKSVDVTGTSKGRGTAGVMKRHNFKGQRATHGVKKCHRHAGSVTSHASNLGMGKIKKGKRMGGRYGASRSTVRNLQVVKVDTDNHLLLLRGAVPGPNGGYLIIRETNMSR